MQHSYSSIIVENLKLYVRVGVSAEERGIKQGVLLHITIQFPFLLQACITDDISDTISYDMIITSMQEFVRDKEFKLIEHLGAKLYEVLQNILNAKLQQYSITLRIRKHPPVSNFDGAVCFEIRDVKTTTSS